MAFAMQRLVMPLRQAHSPTTRIISPAIRTATAFANKMGDGRPLKDMPNEKKKSSAYKIKLEEKAKAPRRKDRYDRPPVPLNVPTMQEHQPTEKYFIQRTPTRNLPVYQIKKAGGNLQQTRIRKIEGQIPELKKELEAMLDPKPEWIRINPVNNHVEMKGWYKSQIDKFLIAKGF